MATVLIIEDERELAAALESVLTSAGHEVLLAEDGRKGIALFRARHPDIVVTDLFMPQVEGLETIMAIKRETPSAKIVAISGGQFLRQAGQFGADVMLSKPFRLRELTAVVEKLAA